MSSNSDNTLEPCYLLHQRAYRDSSAIAELFSRQHGCIALVARGIKSPRSRMRGVLQPFTPLLVSWTGKGELQTLKSAESNGRAVQLPGKWLMSGFYLNELLLRLLMRHDAHETLYDRYELTLQQLSELAGRDDTIGLQGDAAAGKPAQQHQRILRLFEKDLLEELGYGLMLEQEADTGEPVNESAYYRYFPEKGPVLSFPGDRIAEPEPDFQAHGIGIHGASLLSLARDHLLDSDSLKECKRLMRLVIASYIGNKPLYSREMLIKGRVDQQGESRSTSYGE